MSVDLPDTTIPLDERIRGMKRHRRLMVMLFGVGALLTILLVLFLPATYSASATILIEQQEIPQEVVRSTITSFADQRIQVISQRVMTTQNLLAIAEKYNLYPWQRRTRPREVVLARMRDDIKMRLISANVMDPRSGRPMQATIAFTVSFDSSSPEVCVKVANELTSLYLNENIASRAVAAQQASTFLTEEGNRLESEIQLLAVKIANFKKKYVESLPELGSFNFQLLDRTELDQRDANSRLGSIDGQLAFVEAQLATQSPTSQVFTETGQRILSPDDRLKALKADLASLKSKYAPDHPDVVRAEREIAGLQPMVTADNGANDLLRQLDDGRAKLAEASKRYSPDHPDVVRLQRVVASLEGQLADHPAVPRVEAARANPDNPAYIQLRAQRESLLADRAAVVRKQDELRARLNDLQHRLALAPGVEREYRQLATDYENAQLKYHEVRSKQMEAQVSQNLETERKGERFTLIEPPLTPEEPISPNRSLLLALGLLGSVALALGGMMIRDALDESIRSTRDLGAVVMVPPLATIPIIPTAEDRTRQRRGARRVWVGAAVSVAVAVLCVHVFYRPLDMLWFAALRRIGL
jgi:succinoglycan biosynthesis transport protein ExoP